MDTPTRAPARRRFLAGAAAVAGAGAAVAAGRASAGGLAAPRPARLPGRIAEALDAKAGADQVLVPPLSVRTLHRMGFGPMRRRKVAAGSVPPERIFNGGFELEGQPGEDDIGYFQSLGATDDARLAAWVEQQLDPGLADPEPAARMAAHAGSFSTLGQPLATVWSQRECQGFSEYTRPYRELERAAFVRATYSRRQLFELMVDFWHDHFNAYAALNEDTYVAFADWDRRVIRDHAFGNFYAMLYSSARHPVMLRYLDNYRNGDGGINENYARELFELHTLGAENYRGLQQPFSVEALASNPYAGLGDAELDNGTLSAGLAIANPARAIQRYYVDDDVYSAAAALSGWRYMDQNTGSHCGTGAFETDATEVVQGPKALLSRGQITVGSDLDPELSGRLVIKMAAYHPGTATHVARKLCRRLIADEPPAEVVAAAAAEFYARRRSPDQIARTLRVILNSDAFKDPALWGSKTKRPFEYIVSAMRAAGCDYTLRMGDETSDSFFRAYERTAHRLFLWRTPDGYPDQRAHWQGSATLVQSWRCLDWLVDRNAGTPSTRVMRIADLTLANLSGNPTARQLVAFWCDWILGWTPEGGWVGPFGTHWSQAPTALGAAALRFMCQDFAAPDAGFPFPADTPITRAELQQDEWPQYWHSRLRGMVSLILWSPQFLLR